MPRSSKPWWGAGAGYELQIDPNSSVFEEIKREASEGVKKLDFSQRRDLAELCYDDAVTGVCQDAAMIAAWSRQTMPERRRLAQALSEVGDQLGELESALDHLSPPSRSKLGVIDQSNLFDPERIAEAALLLEFPRELLRLSRRLDGTESNDLQILGTQVDACADLLSRLDDFSQSHLLDGLWEQRVTSTSTDPNNCDATQWLLSATKLLRAAANQEAQRLGRKGRENHPWLHWAVSILAERFERLTNKKLTYFVNPDDIPVPSEGGKFIIGVIHASGARVNEQTILNAIRRHVRFKHARSRAEKAE